jgi:Zn-dependent peptidase ImmA (M78 family)/transcriptional regulator with XRE-family HTH domain
MLEFNPRRLKEIRTVKKMTLNQLAAHIGVTKQAASKYELGKSIPSSETIDKICKIFDIPKHYLNKASVTLDNMNSTLFFRTASATTKAEIEFAEINSKWAYEVLLGFDSFESIPTMNLPAIEDTLSIPQKAVHLRQFWNLGTAPIENMTEILESNGIFVFVVNSAELHTDAYSRIINGIPVVVLNEHKGTAVRWRFSLAHELGHLVLHRYLTKTEFEIRSKEIENEASLFADNFLMPPDSFGNSVVLSKLEYFLNLKKQWKVSIAAMIYRCGQLGLFDNQKSAALRMQLSKKWGRKREPFDDEFAFEKPGFLFIRAQKYLADRNGFEQFNNAARLPIGIVEQLCALPEGYFSKNNINMPMEGLVPMEQKQLSLFGSEEYPNA